MCLMHGMPCFLPVIVFHGYEAVVTDLLKKQIPDNVHCTSVLCHRQAFVIQHRVHPETRQFQRWANRRPRLI